MIETVSAQASGTIQSKVPTQNFDQNLRDSVTSADAKPSPCPTEVLYSRAMTFEQAEEERRKNKERVLQSEDIFFGTGEKTEEKIDFGTGGIEYNFTVNDKNGEALSDEIERLKEKFRQRELQQTKFLSDREALVKDNGLTTWYTIAGRFLLENHAFETERRLTFKQVLDKPCDDAYVFDDRPIEWGNITNQCKQRAVLDFADFDELADILIEKSAGKPLTDLIIGTHGNDNTLYHGEDHLFGLITLASSISLNDGFKDFLQRLSNANILRPGARIYLTGCSIAGPKGLAELQKLAEQFSISIIANDNLAYSGFPDLAELKVFYPKTEPSNSKTFVEQLRDGDLDSSSSSITDKNSRLAGYINDLKKLVEADKLASVKKAKISPTGKPIPELDAAIAALGKNIRGKKPADLISELLTTKPDIFYEALMADTALSSAMDLAEFSTAARLIYNIALRLK